MDKGVKTKHGIYAKTVVTPEGQQRNQEKHTHAWSTVQGGDRLCKRWKRNQLKTTILTMMNHNIKSDQLLLSCPEKVQQSGVQLTQRPRRRGNKRSSVPDAGQRLSVGNQSATTIRQRAVALRVKALLHRINSRPPVHLTQITISNKYREPWSSWTSK